MTITTLLADNWESNRRSPAIKNITVETSTNSRLGFRNCCSKHGYAQDLAERTLAHAVANQVKAA